MKQLSYVLALLIGVLLGLVAFVLPDMALSGANAATVSMGIKTGSILVLVLLGFVQRTRSTFLITLFWTAAVTLLLLLLIGTTIRFSELGLI